MNQVAKAKSNIRKQYNELQKIKAKRETLAKEVVRLSDVIMATNGDRREMATAQFEAVYDHYLKMTEKQELQEKAWENAQLAMLDLKFS
jgi:predicted RNase H-like nuclease (RuvC/YqgF family)